MIQIATDSCADLSPELISQHGISVIPLQVFIDNKNILDGDLTLKELFSLVEATGQLPKTSAPAVGEFIKLFEKADETIYIGISSRLSATHQNACLAASHFSDKKIHIVDSLNLSTGIGLLTLKAVDLRDQGRSAEQIEKDILETKSKVCTSFVIDTMEYLYKGGRCNALQAIFGSMLRIRPVIEVRQDGTMGVKEKVRGNRLKALNSMLEDFKNHLPDIDFHRVFITHTGCDDDAEYLKTELLKIAPIENVLITYAGATIGSHCGPNTIGILFLRK